MPDAKAGTKGPGNMLVDQWLETAKAMPFKTYVDAPANISTITYSSSTLGLSND